MRLFRSLALGLFVLVTGVVLVAYLLPRNVIVERQITIAGAPSDIFPLVNSLQRVAEWSPWTVRDPNMTVTYEGPLEGVGNVMIWTSTAEGVSDGRQEIVESIANARVVTLLDFNDMGTTRTRFDLREVAGGTEVTWRLDTDMGMNPIGRWMGFMMDRLVGPDYEAGLANLQDMIEEGG